MYRITFQQIHYFLALAKTLNFTEAAKSLYISQPALSKQMLVLENELGFSLLKRNKRNVELTPEGESLYRDWSMLENMMNSSIYNAKLLKRKTVGKLSIGCTDTFSVDEMLSKVLYNYQSHYPNIDIDLGSFGFRTLRDQFNNRDLDVIFVPEFELESYKDVNSFLFQKVELCIAVPSSHPLSKRDHVTVTDLKDQPLITISPKESVVGVSKIKNICKAHGFEANIVKYVSNLNSLLLGVKNGIGITICDNKVRDPKIKTFNLDKQPDDSNIYVLWKTGLEHAELELFLDELREMLDFDEGED
ncbi:LysR family transcriptional regulator [Konateibacter massiliensis]|uniref:LysR family transcriptional regulator n=1 Tax=Konateibacter massiliensis TaxID=2002841 RepID=UPI000C14D064|nr:LysR family transcriptional regulator [Konateibacter massiliensis]